MDYLAMYFVLFAFCILAPSFYKAQTTETNHSPHCANPGRIANPQGDVVLGGLFPVHIVQPTEGTKQAHDINLYGLTWVEAMLFTVQEINNNPSLLPINFTVGYDIRDSCNDVPVALEAALDFVLDAGDSGVNGSTFGNCTSQYCKCTDRQSLISAVIGAASSPISINVANLLGVDSTPQISYSSTSVLLSDSDIYHSFFRTIPSDTYQAQALADLLKQFGWTYVSIVASDNSYGRAGVDSLRQELKERSICIALEAIFNPSLTQEELGQIIESLRNEPRAKVIILWCQRPNALGFLNEASRQRLTGKTWIGTETWGDAYQLETLDESIVGGMLGVLPLLEKHTPFEEHLARLKPNNTDYNLWMWEYWTSRFGCFRRTEPTNLSSSSTDREVEFYVYTTNRANVTILCPKNFGKGVPRAEFLPRNKYTNVMDAIYAVVYTVKNILDCKDGEGLLEGGKCPSVKPFIAPSDILVYLKNVSFTGRSGTKILFDKNGDLQYGSYAIKNLQQSTKEKMQFVEIGIWSGLHGNLSLKNNSEIIWNGWTADKPKSTCADICEAGYYPVKGSVPCCWKCVQCEKGFVKADEGQSTCNPCPDGFVANGRRTSCTKLKSDYLAWENGEGVSAAVLAVAGLIITLGVLVVFYKHRQTAVVKASNRELSFVHLTCIAAIFILPLLSIGKPTVAGCAVAPLFFGIPFTLCTAIMLLKTDRLLRIFRARSRLTSTSSYLLSNKMQAIAAMAMTLVPVTMTTVWFIIHHPEVLVEADNTREGWQIFSCGHYNELLTIVMLGYVLVLALLCTYFAFKARKLPENFNEAKFICFAMFAFCVFWLSFFPAFYDSTGSTRTFVFCVAVLGSGFAVLCIMYAPKLRVILFHPESNTTEAFRITTMAAIQKTAVVVSSTSNTPPPTTPLPSPVPSRHSSPIHRRVADGRTSAVNSGRTNLPSPRLERRL